MNERRVMHIVVVAMLVLGGCGGVEEASSATDAVPTEETVEDVGTPQDIDEEDLVADVDDLLLTDVDLDVVCPALDRVTNLLLEPDALEDTARVEAEAAAVGDIDAILEEVEEDLHPDLVEALRLLSVEAFVFPDGPSVDPEVLEAATGVAITAWNDSCLDHDLDAVSPVEEEPAAEEPGASGAEDEFDEECPSPETLEAEGLECDEFGNVYPAGDYSDGHGDDPEYDPDFGGDGCEGDDCFGDDPYAEDFGGDGCEGDDCFGDEPDPEAFGADGCEGDDC